MNNHIGFRSRRAFAAAVCGTFGFFLGFLLLLLASAHAQTASRYDPVYDDTPGRVGHGEHELDVDVAKRLLGFYKCIPADDRKRFFAYVIDDLESQVANDEKRAAFYAGQAKRDAKSAKEYVAEHPEYEDSDFAGRLRADAKVAADLANDNRLEARTLRNLIARLKSLPPCPPTRVSGAGIAGGTALHIAAPAPVSGTAGSLAAPEVVAPSSYTFGRSQSYYDFTILGILFKQVTITSPTDKDKFKFNAPTFQVGGQFSYGPWFAGAQVAVPIFPNGTLTEGFGGSSSSTFNINTGLIGNFQANAGYYVYQTPNTQIGLIGQFYASSESLAGALPGSATEVPLLTDRWLAGGAGVKFDQRFSLGGVPITFNASVSGLFDNVRSGSLNANGGGVQAGAGFYTPLGPGQVGISAQYTDLNGSGSSMGVPLRQIDQDLLFSAYFIVHTVIIP